MRQVSLRPDGMKARYIHLQSKCFDANLMDPGTRVSHFDSADLGKWSRTRDV